MIIKLVGMAIVFLASVLIGVCFAECFAERERELTNLATALEVMAEEIGYTMASLKDTVSAIAPRVNGKCKNFFESMVVLTDKGMPLPEAWEKALFKTAPSMSFTREDAQYVASRKYLLCAYGLEEQLSNLSGLKTGVLRLAESARIKKDRNGRLSKLLGIYGGVLLCIIML